MKKLSLLIFFILLFPLNAHSQVISKIELVGLKWTKVAFVRRELLFKEGDTYSEEKLKKSVRNLLNTHLFYRIETQVREVNGKVVVKLRFKEKFPLVPIPRMFFKTNGSFKGGVEVRDYNLFGMGHRLYVGYTRWFKTENTWKDAFIYTRLYRFLKDKSDLSAGIFWNKGENVSYTENGRVIGTYSLETISLPVYVTSYLDLEKVKQLTVGVKPYFINYSKFYPNKRFYFFNLGLAFDRTTDMVYYVKGSRVVLYGEVAEPLSSSSFTGALFFSWENTIHTGSVNTYSYALAGGTKVGYSGELPINSYIPGYKSSEIVNRRFLKCRLSLRRSLFNRSVFFKPTVVLGDAFESSPDDLLVATGFEISAFWAKLVDGIIRFRIYKGIGKNSDTQTNLKFDFRW
ncbi:MAG: hypothetical protein DSY35_04895 [Desulfurobacterium sp.]|nr:MAG: hypothetical protein DSY35_04895 [Desulfurobacterium sp.]